MPYVAGRGVEPIQPTAGADVNAPPEILSDAINLIAGKTLSGRIRHEARMVRSRFFDVDQTVLGTDPEPAAAIKIERLNPLNWQPVGSEENSEATCSVADQSAIPSPDPDIA